MITTIGELKRLIREFGLDATMRNQAGFGDTGGVSTSVRNRRTILNSPPGLGDEAEQEDNEISDDDLQRKSQASVRYADRQKPPKV